MYTESIKKWTLDRHKLLILKDSWIVSLKQTSILFIHCYSGKKIVVNYTHVMKPILNEVQGIQESVKLDMITN